MNRRKMALDFPHSQKFGKFYMLHRWSLFVCLSFSLQSCETWRFSAPTEDLSIRTPGSWQRVTTGEERSITTGWLEQFNDSGMTSTVNEALAHNQSLKVSAAKLREAREVSIIARASQLPSAGISGGVGTSDSAGSERRDSFQLNLAASWELDLWGRLRDASAAAAAEEVAAIEDYRGARLSLAANTAKAWCNLISAAEEVSLAQTTLDSFQKNLRFIERSYKGTGDGALDIKFGRTNVASAQRALESRMTERDEAARSLEVLLGRYPSGWINAGRELPKLAARIPAGIPAELLDRRPDLSAARARIFASAKRADAARKALLPAVSLTGNAGVSTLELADLLDVDGLIGAITARFSQILTEGGTASAEARIALARNDQEIHNYAQLALEGFREVEATLAADRSLAKQETFLASELEQAALAERQSEREYAEGINPNILSVLEAQRRANNARASMIRLRNQRLQNRIDLHLALGGDFQTTL